MRVAKERDKCTGSIYVSSFSLWYVPFVMVAIVLDFFVLVFLHVMLGSNAPATETRVKVDVIIAGIYKGSFFYLIILMSVPFSDRVVSLRRVSSSRQRRYLWRLRRFRWSGWADVHKYMSGFIFPMGLEFPNLRTRKIQPVLSISIISHGMYRSVGIDVNVDLIMILGFTWKMINWYFDRWVERAEDSESYLYNFLLFWLPTGDCSPIPWCGDVTCVFVSGIIGIVTLLEKIRLSWSD